MEGILPLWKERGMTSHDCVFQLRRILQTKKVGHTGTLDPEVDGVLPICIGSATKAVEFMTDMGKAYKGEVTLGFSTTTEDAYGEIVDQKPVPPELSVSEIDEKMASFIGEIIQIPPMYSAVKVKGKKLYEYARAGQEVERPQRKAQIYSFKRTSEPIYDAAKQTLSWKFQVECGKGTYIRTLAVDLGNQLGYPAHMTQLTRTQSGPFRTEDCYTLDQIKEYRERGAVQDVLQPLEILFQACPRIELSEDLWKRVKNGAVIEETAFSNHEKEPLLALFYENKLVALYEVHPSRPSYKKPRKMFLS